MAQPISSSKAIAYDSVNLLRNARAREKSLLKFLQALVELESPTEEKTAVDRCVEFTAEAAARMGATVHRHRNRNSGDVLEARFAAANARRGIKPVLLLGHLDTVWPLGTLAEMPFRIKDGRAFGPGAYDMKAGIAMALAALDLLQTEGLLNRPVVLLLTGDEETGSHASRAVMEKTASRCECVYVLEPAQGLEGAYKTARKGIANYTVHVTGVAAHSGVNYERGHSAIAELARQVGAIESLTDLKRGTTVNVGTIHGGTRSNVVPAEARAEVDVRVARASDFARIDRKLKKLRVQDRQCVLKVEGGLNRPPWSARRQLWRCTGARRRGRRPWDLNCAKPRPEAVQTATLPPRWAFPRWMEWAR